jgi:hypothetical protein
MLRKSLSIAQDLIDGAVILGGTIGFVLILKWWLSL